MNFFFPRTSPFGAVLVLLEIEFRLGQSQSFRIILYLCYVWILYLRKSETEPNSMSGIVDPYF